MKKKISSSNTEREKCKIESEKGKNKMKKWEKMEGMEGEKRGEI